MGDDDRQSRVFIFVEVEEWLYDGDDGSGKGWSEADSGNASKSIVMEIVGFGNIFQR